MNEIRRLLHYVGPYRRDAVLGIIFVALETSLELLIPLLMANIIDEGVASGDTRYIFEQGAIMLALALLSLVLGLG